MAGIDSSIYQSVQAPQINLPSPLDSASKALSLSQLGMQNRALQVQQQQQQLGLAQSQAVRQAYSENTDQNGNLNRQGFLSSLGKNPYTAGMQTDYASKFAAQDKATADAQKQQLENAQARLSITMPALETLASMPESQRAQAYPQVMQRVAQMGVPMDQVPADYNKDWFRQAYTTGLKMKDYLANQLTAAQTQKTQKEYDQQGLQKAADELSKFNEDVNNASSRKTSGSLISTINSADRMASLANAGAPANETPEQKTQRLNQIIPQLAKEYNIQLASLMQGGIPTEALVKEVDPDTLQANIASLKQKFDASPTAANQGALIQEYLKQANHIRDFAAGRLQEVANKAKAAYPYAQKYFPDRMDQIAAPLTKPGAAGISADDAAEASQSSRQAPGKSGADPKDMAALEWLKTADPSSPVAFKVRAKLKSKGLI